MNTLIAGRRLQGKSTLAMYLAQQIRQQCGWSIAIFDPRRCFKRFPTARSVEEFVEALDEGQSPVLVYQPQHNVVEEFNEFMEVLWRKRCFVLIVDEASQVQSPGSLHPQLDRFVRMADPDEAVLIQTMHRPADSNTLCRALATEWFFFKTTLVHDLQVVEEYCGLEVAQHVQSLPLHHCVRYNVDTSQEEVWNQPHLWRTSIKEEYYAGASEQAGGEAAGSASPEAGGEATGPAAA